MSNGSMRTRRTVRTFAAVALGAAAAMVIAAPAGAQDARTITSERLAFRVVTVVSGLENPWGLAFLPSGDMLVTERPGRLRIVRNGTLLPEPVAGVPEVRARGQGGLLDVVLHPQFATNNFVYLSFSKPGSEGATTAVVRGRLDGNRLTDVREIFVSNGWSTGGNHFGSRMAFDRDGMLYITAGDRGMNPNADNHNGQNLRVHAGSVIRLHDDGRVPRDNPFVGRSDALPEIFSYGHRNPQALAMNPQTGQLWATEHGARGGDELNVLRPGRNYGWPVITHGINYNGQSIGIGKEKEGMEQPVAFWVPSIATSGMAFYTGDRFPEWKGDVFVGGLAGQVLERITLRGAEAMQRETVLREHGRIRDVRNGPDGLIYLLIDAGNGSLVRLEPVTR
jgi:glucose/arabinose dehydrogenase